MALENASVYEASDTAIEAIEKAYADTFSKAPGHEKMAYEAAYVAKASAKVTIYEMASKAISAMAHVATDKKAAIAAVTIASIRRFHGS